jgi:iron uptake system component EfeO
MYTRLSSLFVCAAALAACDSQSPRDQALYGTKSYIQQRLDALVTASEAIQAAAPAGGANGWDVSGADAAAIASMKAHWREARVAYESIEGAIAVLFPDLDVSTDERYDGFLGAGPDADLFDDKGVTGIHAIERILWSDAIPPTVIDFESALPGYEAARFPKTQAEAQAFKTKLCQRLVDDVHTMQAQFAPLALDPAAAYRGIIGSMSEQVEKADKAATGEEESRYAQYTLADMRTNVAAGVATYDNFARWVKSSPGGTEADAAIRAGFERVNAAYAGISGDALPPVPKTWSSVSPSMSDLATPFGQLYGLLKHEADPAAADSLVSAMNRSADLLGIPQLP